MKTSLCKGCGAAIIWIKTAKGKNMPVNAKASPVYQINDQEETFQVMAHIPHWITCPQRDEFKKGR